MRTTIVGNYEDFAAASRVAAQLMIAGFAQAEISVVGREQVSDGARFAFAGALAQDLSGARDEDFVQGRASLFNHLGAKTCSLGNHFLSPAVA